MMQADFMENMFALCFEKNEKLTFIGELQKSLPLEGKVGCEATRMRWK